MCISPIKNKKWFKNVYPELKDLWNTILKERIEGYEHRRFKKKKKTKKLTPTSLNKLQEETKSLFIDSELSPKIDNNQNIVIKIRTESFDNKSS